jgi:hypothetical protein
MVGETVAGLGKVALDSLIEEKLRGGTATWKDAFFHPRREGPADPALRDVWLRLLEGSRAERQARGFYTYDELLKDFSRVELDVPESLREGVRKDIMAGVKGLRGYSGGDGRMNAALFPNLEYAVGDCVIDAPGAGRSLRNVTGSLDVEAGADMGMLRSVGGSLKVGAPLEAGSLTKVGGDMSVGAACRTGALKSVGGSLAIGSAAFVAPVLAVVGGVLSFVSTAVRAALDQETKDSTRRVRSGKVFDMLAKSEAEGMKKGALKGLSKLM